MTGAGVCLHVAPLPADEILHPASGIVEGGVDGRVEILVGVIALRQALGHDLTAGDRDVDANSVVLAMPRVPMRPLEGDAATDDARVEPVEFPGPEADVLLDRVRVIEAVESDLQRKAHALPNQANAAPLSFDEWPLVPRPFGP
jgi:hypothetical protein